MCNCDCEYIDDLMMEPTVYRLPLIGDNAPEFTAKTTNGEINFPADYEGKWVILFSHPADFTPVCTTEFMTFASMQDEFKALNTELIGLSIDSVYSHIAWIKKMEEIEFNGMKDTKVTFPIIDDLSMEVATKYGMIQPNVSTTSAVRAIFIIDPKGLIRTILYYPASTGRNFTEIKRIIEALQKADKDDIATPANWQPGQPVIVPPADTTAEANKRVAAGSDKQKEVKDWFMVVKK